MKRLFIALLALTALLVLGVATFAMSGLYDVAADVPHTRPVAALLDTLRERSIARRAAGIAVPVDLDDAERVRRGAGNYDAMCVGCHLRPGLDGTELSRGLYPAPPNLAQRAIDSPAAAFWVVKHGIKASGMPAWGHGMGDEYIWDLVAFVQALPAMDAEGYRTIVAASDGHAHGGGEDHDHGDGHGHDHGEHDHGEEGHGEEDAGEHGHGAPATAEGTVHVHADGSRHVHAAPAESAPLRVAREFRAALARGDEATVQTLLAPEVLIFEGGGVERSREEYASHHMRGDMSFLKSAHYTLLRQSGDAADDIAWVAGEAEIEGAGRKGPVRMRSTETLVLRRTGDDWRIVHIHWSDRPLTD